MYGKFKGFPDSALDGFVFDHWKMAAVFFFGCSKRLKEWIIGVKKPAVSLKLCQNADFLRVKIGSTSLISFARNDVFLVVFWFFSGHSECPDEMFCWIFSRFFFGAGWPEGEHSQIRWEPQNWLQGSIFLDLNNMARCMHLHLQRVTHSLHFAKSTLSWRRRTYTYIYLQISIRYQYLIISHCISIICDLYLYL